MSQSILQYTVAIQREVKSFSSGKNRLHVNNDCNAAETRIE